MKKIGIIQPGRIGDIIILLPAIKQLADQGNHIIWPIFDNMIWMFTEVVKYVTFVPVTSDVYKTYYESHDILTKIYKVDQIIDTAATFPGSTVTDAYVKSGDGNIIHSDQFKYDILGLPLNLKWSLKDCIVRDMNKEQELFNKLVKQKNYVVINLTCSLGKYDVKIDAGDAQIIEATTEYNIFHWIKILENAQAMLFLNSSMACLAEQIDAPGKKTIFKIPTGKFPTFRNKWTII